LHGVAREKIAQRYTKLCKCKFFYNPIVGMCHPLGKSDHGADLPAFVVAAQQPDPSFHLQCQVKHNEAPQSGVGKMLRLRGTHIQKPKQSTQPPASVLGNHGDARKDAIKRSGC
jgi:hypothetical protein